MGKQWKAALTDQNGWIGKFCIMTNISFALGE